MTKDEVIKKMNAGELTYSESSGFDYEDCVCKIDELTIEEGKSSKLEHPLLNYDGCFLAAHLTIKFPDDSKIKHVEVGGFMNKKGDISCHPTFEKNGEKKPGNLLYDIKHNCKEFNKTQLDKIEQEKAFNIKTYEGMYFKMRVKLLGVDNKVILETSRQKIKDGEYAQDQEAKKGSVTNAPESKVNAIDDELPF